MAAEQASGDAELALRKAEKPGGIRISETDSTLEIEVPGRFSTRRLTVGGAAIGVGLLLLGLASGPITGVLSAVAIIAGLFALATSHTSARLEADATGWTFEERLWSIPMSSSGLSIDGTSRIEGGLLGEGTRLRIYAGRENLEFTMPLTSEEVDRLESALDSYSKNRG